MLYRNIPNCHRAEWAQKFYQLRDQKGSNTKGEINVIITSDVICSVGVLHYCKMIGHR